MDLKLLIFPLLIFSATAFAVGPQFWEFATQADLLKGRLEGVSLTSDGRIVLAPRYELLFDAEQAYLFSMAKDSQGNVYVGSGHEGKVFKIGPKGEGKVIFKAREFDIFALAVDGQDNLYAGSSPDGKVYKIAPNGEAQEFFDPQDKYIWALACDKFDNVYVATGGRGLIYKVSKGGKGQILFDSEETHIISLAVDSDGNVLAGSSPNGHLYRIAASTSGKAFVLYDSTLNELRSICVDPKGGIYAVALSDAAVGAIEPLPAVAKPATEGKKTSEGSKVLSDLRPAPKAEQIFESKPEVKPTLEVASPGKEVAGAKSIIFYIRPDGTMETVWSSKEDAVYSLLVRDDGHLLASTGTKGRILLISPDRTVTILVESSEEQVTALLAKGEDVYAATSNLGKVFVLRPERARTGYYESEVRDAGTLSSWGMISWRTENPTGRAIEIYTRTGNTEKPDKTWSDWAGPYRNPEGEQIRSPRARYIQWRAVFRGDGNTKNQPPITDALEKVTLAFLPQNLPPRVTAISMLPPGIALQRMPVVAPVAAATVTTGSAPQPSAPTQPKTRMKMPPQQRQQPGAQAITWKAEDDNDDELEYTLYFRAEGESDWKPLEKNLTDEFYTIDSNALPDGVYRLKVVASDAPSNPYNQALTGELISRPFIIDNTPPVIEIISHRIAERKVQIDFLASDRASRIVQAEFSIDGGPWRILFPKDGIADSKAEEYRLLTPELEDGEHTVALRASDTVGNVGTNKLTVKISN